MKSANIVRSAVRIPTENEYVNGDLTVPEGARGIVLFAHGSGSSRFSPRNTYVAQLMNQPGLATLLIDLLTEREASLDEYTGQYRFDVQMLAERLIDATNWLKSNPTTQTLSVGYFGASTGAAAALIAAATLPSEIRAVVSRGGRPDLAAEKLSKVQAPTLLIVGGNDPQVLKLNQEAFQLIHTEKRLEVVAGATHLFEEPGKLEEAATLALDWFKKHL